MKENMKKTRIIMITVVLGLSLGTAAQLGMLNGIGQGVMTLFNGAFPNGVGTNTAGTKTIDNSFTNPGYQGSPKVFFDVAQQNAQLSASFPLIDGGFGKVSSQLHAQIAGNTYFDFESGISSSTSFSTADMYYDTSKNAWAITPVNGAMANDLGQVSWSSLNQDLFSTSKFTKNPIKGNPPTWKIVNGTMIQWLTVEGNEVRMRVDFFSNPMLITYGTLYYFSIDGNADFLAQATANGWTGNGTASNPIVISGYNIKGVGAFIIQNTDLHFIMQNNVFTGSGSNIAGVELDNVSNGVFTNNTVTNYGIAFNGNQDTNLAFNSNTMSGNIQQGALIQESKTVSFTGNTITNNGGSGILVANTTSVSVTSNTVNFNSKMVSTSPTVISGGINLVYSTGTVTGNTLTGNLGNGILLFGVNGAVVSGSNDVTTSGQSGIFVFGSNNSVVDSNTFDSNTADGITITTSEYITVSGNTMTNNGANGLTWINSSYGTIVGNQIIGNNKLALANSKVNGIVAYAYGSGVFMDPSYYNVVEDNIISGNAQGVSVNGSEYNQFLSNSVTNNAINGFSIVNSSSNTIQYNNITGNSNPNATIALNLKIGSASAYAYGSGVFMDPSSNNTVSNNNIDGNYGYGVYLLSSDQNHFDSNSFSGNGLNGAYIINSNYNTITNSKFSNNNNPLLQLQLLSAFKPGSVSAYAYGSGVFMDPSNYNTITNNIFDSNYGNGLEVSASSYNTIQSNHMTNNALNGLSIEESSNNNIFTNTLTGNGNVTLQVAFLSYGKPAGITAYAYGSGVFMDPSTNNNFIGNTINNNYGYGSWVQSSNNNVLDSNTVMGNALDGVFVDNSNYNSITNNHISANSNPALQSVAQRIANAFKPGSITAYAYGSGVFMDPSVGNYVAGNIISNSPFNGILVQESNSNVFDSNTISNSGQNGFELDNSSYNNVTSNTVTGSGNSAVLNTFLSYGKPSGFTAYAYGSGVFMDPSVGNLIAYNHLTNNNGYGMYAQQSNGNAIYYNALSFNTQNGFYSESSSSNSLAGNSFVKNTLYGTYFDSNSHGSTIGHNDYVLNTPGASDGQAYDNGGNSYNNNFFLNENPNTAYTISGSSGSTDPTVSATPSTDLSQYHLPPVSVNFQLTAVSLQIGSSGNYMDAHIYFSNSTSAYLVNASSIYASFNGHRYYMLYVSVDSQTSIHVKFDRQALQNDVYNYFLANGITSSNITIDINGAFNGNFLAFNGSDSISAFE